MESLRDMMLQRLMHFPLSGKQVQNNSGYTRIEELATYFQQEALYE